MHFFNEHIITYEVIHQWREKRQCCSSFLRNLTFRVICDNMLNITTSPHHCAANHAVNCENPTDLTRCDPHEYYQVNCCSVSHRTTCYAWFVAMDLTFNIQPILNILKWIKSNRTIRDKEDLMIFFFSNLSFLDINSKWGKIYVIHYYFNEMYNAACFLIKNDKSVTFYYCKV